MKKIYFLIIAVAALFLSSCEKPIIDEVEDAIISIRLSNEVATKAADGEGSVVISNFRLFILDSDKVVKTLSTTGEEFLEISLPAKTYSFVALVNEPTIFTTELDAIAVDATNAVATIQGIINGDDILASQATYANHFAIGTTTAALVAGKNYLGYSSPAADGTDLGEFKIARVVAKLKIVLNDTDDKFAPEEVFVMNAKNMLTLTAGFGAGTYFETVPTYNATNFPAPNYIYDYSSFTQGSVANTVGGSLLPRLYSNVGSDVVPYSAASADQRLVNVTPNAVLSSTTPASSIFYVLPNGKNGADAPEYATRVVVKGTYTDDASVTSTRYFVAIVNPEATMEGYSYTGGRTSFFVEANNQYEMTLNLNGASVPVLNPWVGDATAFLDVQIAVADWAATISQTVNF